MSLNYDFVAEFHHENVCQAGQALSMMVCVIMAMNMDVENFQSISKIMKYLLSSEVTTAGS